MKRQTKIKLIFLIIVAPIITGVILGCIYNKWIWFLIPILLMAFCYFVGMFLASVLAYVEKREPID